MRKIVLTACAVTAVTALAACGGGSSGGQPAGGGADNAPLIGSDYPRSDTDFWNSYIRYTPQFGEVAGRPT